MNTLTIAENENFSDSRPTFWGRIYNALELVGYARAAAELSRQGYYEQARMCMLEREKLKSK